ncbi:MAG TPA: hypothetical protein VL381_02180 [Rhodocyclaceae bacterium]|nr:hypothetical protein [Rhodocyclaceae bacterium]
MSRELSFKVEEEGDIFIAQCLDEDISSDGLTREEALTNLQEALALYFDNDDITLIENKRP